MRIGFLKIVAIIGLALVFNACGSRIDESVQDNIQEEQYSQDSNAYNEESNSSASSEEESSSGESYSQNDEENTEIFQQQEGDPIDILIESKIESAGELTFTEYEFSDEIALRAIERRISFALTHLDDRDAMINKIGHIMKQKGETYSVVSEISTKDAITNTAEGSTLGAMGGGIIARALSSGLSGALAGSVAPGPGTVAGALFGATAGLLYSFKDRIKGVFFKPNWLISKSPDETILNIKVQK